jgi:RNA polymerase sigma factor (sigma-70 family)
MGQVGGGPHSERTSDFLAVQRVAQRRLQGHAVPLVRRHADDLAMEVVTRFAAARQRQPIVNVEAWATTTARNVAHDFLDLKANARTVLDVEAPRWHVDLPQGHAALERLVDPTGSPSRQAFTHDQAVRLLAALTPKQQLLVLYAAEGVPQQEIAQLLGYRSADSVKSALTDLRRDVEQRAAALGIDPSWRAWP